ncbi:sulfotransferase family protein [Salisaeta longa]|uniref:sulfotransferase family protein n=1 Tax=Salisaeta longa TaxID=503170 RepID=UPI000429F696|nr:sulfotransferase [Salisaeta longa]
MPESLSFVDLLYRTWRRERKHRYVRRPLTLQRVVASVRPRLRQPVFIVGAPRSGTSFLGRCIAHLPGLSYHFEPPFTKAAARHVYRGNWSTQRAARYYRRVYRWLLRAWADGDERFAEKTPRNCFLIPFLYDTFPDARFVHIVRDGRDAALSHSQKPWMQPQGAGADDDGQSFGTTARFWVAPERREAFAATTTFHRCIWTWRRHVAAARAGLAHVPTHQQHTLRYEALVQEPAATGAALARFLGYEAPVSAGFAEALAEARDDSVGAWQTALTVAQQQVAAQEAGALLKTLGYATPPHVR